MCTDDLGERRKSGGGDAKTCISTLCGKTASATPAAASGREPRMSEIRKIAADLHLLVHIRSDEPLPGHVRVEWVDKDTENEDNVSDGKDEEDSDSRPQTLPPPRTQRVPVWNDAHYSADYAIVIDAWNPPALTPAMWASLLRRAVALRRRIAVHSCYNELQSAVFCQEVFGMSPNAYWR